VEEQHIGQVQQQQQQQQQLISESNQHPYFPPFEEMDLLTVDEELVTLVDPTK